MFEKFLGRPIFRSRAHAITVAVGFVVGAVFGDLLFVVVELAIGNPWDELVFGLAGAALASILFEIWTFVRS
jgi:large-conductance mechanosensitive channel